MDKLVKFANLPFHSHIEIGALIRIALILYSVYHDSYSTVPYTDSEYKVYTDAAEHVSNGDSPYKSETFRDSPLIAFMLIPNQFYGFFGKEIFCIFDILVAITLQVLVYRQLKSKKNASKVAKYCSYVWIYNPMTIAISTRGNADSITCFFVILSLFFQQTGLIDGLLKYVVSGIFLALSIHLSLYPLVLSFPMYLSLGDYKINGKTKLVTGVLSLMPNRKQNALAFSCIITLFSLTYAMHALYGHEFLSKTYFYHQFRKDTLHTLAVTFYHSYLTIDVFSIDGIKTVLQMCEGLILLVISFTYGTNQETLPFALFCQSVVLAVYHNALKSQYFMWFLSLLPLVIHSLKISATRAFLLFSLWVSAYGTWLFFVYLLEFKGGDVFFIIWFQSVIFFGGNTLILSELIQCYTPGYGFGLLVNKVTEKPTEGESK